MNPDNNTLITMTLSVSEWNLIVTGLGELPLKHSAELWMKVRNLAALQLKEVAKGPTSEKGETDAQ
jgi:hypothetical protein